MNKMKYTTLCCVLGISYFLLAKAGLSFALVQANISPIWPPTGFAIAAILYFGYRVWPAIFIASFVVNTTSGIGLIATLGIAIGNTLEAIAASFLILKWIGNAPFNSAQSTLTFYLVVLLTTTISATIGVTSLLLTYVIDGQQLLLFWTTWWLGDAVGGLVVTPLIFTLIHKPTFVLNKVRYYELTALFIGTLLSVIIVFSGTPPDYSFSFFLIPTLVWAALRFQQHGAMTMIVLYTLVAIYSTLHGTGPFVLADTNESLLLLQSFIAIALMTALIIATSVDKTMRIEIQLQKTQQSLQQLLKVRTDALSESHHELDKAIDRREASTQLLQRFSQATTLPSGEQYFNDISKALAQIHNTRYAFIGVFSDHHKTAIRTLSVWSGSHHIDNFTYELKGTPCQDVLNLKLELIEKEVAKLYPDDALLVQMGIESYFGTPIISADNSILGIIVVMDTQPMAVNDWVSPVLSVIAKQIRFEIEQDQVKQELQLAASVFNETAEAIIICDGQTQILRINPAFSQITGYNAEEAIGQTPGLFTSDKHSQAFYQYLWETIDKSGSWQGEVWNKHKSGEVFPCWQTFTAVKDKRGEVIQYIGVFSDITDKKQAEEQIYHLAHFDILTGLPNRNQFIEQLGMAMEKAQSHQQTLALLFIDLDQFKLVNNCTDHSTGDILLIHIAERLRQFVNPNVVISRLGGDEFSLFVKGLTLDDGGDGDAITNIEALANDILVVLSAPFKLDVGEVVVSASIGYCFYPDDATSVHELLRNADIAMYKAKADGINQYCRYTPQMNLQVKQRVEIEQALREAVKQRQFILHYQPLLQLDTGLITGCEALVRWDHPQQGVLPPAHFIPVAEQSGLIISLGNWILQEACRQFVQWQTQGLKLDFIAVNLSASQFAHHDLGSTIERICDRTGMNPQHLELELTESVLMKNIDQSIRTMKRLRAMGIKLSIDDFGTGYSSMAYLKHFPIDKLKIDRSFINGLPGSSSDAAIVNASLNLAHGLGLSVIAEGVETAEQLNYLRAHDCEMVQGYAISVPRLADSPQLFRLLANDLASNHQRQSFSGS